MNQNLKHLIPLMSTAIGAAHEHYRRAGLVHVPAPQIVGITGACENVDTLFRIGNRLRVPLFFCQTGQLNLEQALQYNPGVYTIMVSGRDEEEEDDRHLRQFNLIEEEFDWTLVSRETYDEETMYEALLKRIEAAVKNIVWTVADQQTELLESVFRRDAAWIMESMKRPFHRLSYEDALAMLRVNGFPKLVWGVDLKNEHEARIVELMNGDRFPRPVFIMRYPKEIKFFNMKVSESDKRVAMSADLIFPHSGEGVGSAVREHDGTKLEQRLLASEMFRLHVARGGSSQDFRWYLNLVSSGRTRPHAGYGIGLERVLQYILGIKDIRQCSVFHLMAQQTCDWKVPITHHIPYQNKKRP